MATYSKVLLSGATSNKPILVAATATPGTLIHTSHATAIDEVWLYASNTSTSSVTLTIEFGGTTTAENIKIPINPQAGLFLVIPGVPLTGSSAIRAFAGTANVINVTGYVNRIS